MHFSNFPKIECFLRTYAKNYLCNGNGELKLKFGIRFFGALHYDRYFCLIGKQIFEKHTGDVEHFSLHIKINYIRRLFGEQFFLRNQRISSSARF